jgi:hypothetical protein
MVSNASCGKSAGVADHRVHVPPGRLLAGERNAIRQEPP